MTSYLMVTVDDDAEHVHPSIYLTREAALEHAKKWCLKAYGVPDDPFLNKEDMEILLAQIQTIKDAKDFQDLYDATDGTHWGENNIKQLHIIDLAKAEPMF